MSEVTDKSRGIKGEKSSVAGQKTGFIHLQREEKDETEIVPEEKKALMQVIMRDKVNIDGVIHPRG